MQIERHKLPPPKRLGPNVKRVRRSDWGDICERYVAGDSLDAISRDYETTVSNIIRAMYRARWRIWRAVKVLSGEEHAAAHMPIEDGFTPWLEERVRTNTLVQLQWFLSKLPEVKSKPRRVK